MAVLTLSGTISRKILSSAHKSAPSKSRELSERNAKSRPMQHFNKSSSFNCRVVFMLYRNPKSVSYCCSCSNHVFMEVTAWSIMHKKCPVPKACSADNVPPSVLSKSNCLFLRLFQFCLNTCSTSIALAIYFAVFMPE